MNEMPLVKTCGCRYVRTPDGGLYERCCALHHRWRDESPVLTFKQPPADAVDPHAGNTGKLTPRD
jgi:hypothetical protein